MVAIRGCLRYNGIIQEMGGMVMEATTIGQRIARERKRLNLSQEAFGEKMGVSRQAIS